jgi:hypothetical protein
MCKNDLLNILNGKEWWVNESNLYNRKNTTITIWKLW